VRSWLEEPGNGIRLAFGGEELARGAGKWHQACIWW
jgi:hypothetical protein